jgi:AraC-like DNA-binding protein
MNLLNEHSCILIHSVHGAGSIETMTKTFHLADRQILLLDHPCMISPKILPWNMRIYMIAGSDLMLYPSAVFNQVLDCTSFSVFLEKAAHFPIQINSYDLFDMHRSLTNIFTSASLMTIERVAEDPFIPSYLQGMHEIICLHPEKPFSLAYFEKKYNISRYRLAHEYSSYYHISPLKQCNQLRIDKAKEMLISSNLQVQEISRIVGMNDVNHFIQLFRRTFGCSPNAFRKMERDHQSLPNSHVE